MKDGGQALANMSLRDYFAAKALAAILSSPDMLNVAQLTAATSGIAKSMAAPAIAYAYADAMIIQREKEAGT